VYVVAGSNGTKPGLELLSILIANNILGESSLVATARRWRDTAGDLPGADPVVRVPDLPQGAAAMTAVVEVRPRRRPTGPAPRRKPIRPARVCCTCS